jgi:hypothetical protein
VLPWSLLSFPSSCYSEPRAYWRGCTYPKCVAHSFGDLGMERLSGTYLVGMTRLDHEHSIYIESLIIYELLPR